MKTVLETSNTQSGEITLTPGVNYFVKNNSYSNGIWGQICGRTLGSYLKGWYMGRGSDGAYEFHFAGVYGAEAVFRFTEQRLLDTLIEAEENTTTSKDGRRKF